jgi:hypothetical protein
MPNLNITLHKHEQNSSLGNGGLFGMYSVKAIIIAVFLVITALNSIAQAETWGGGPFQGTITMAAHSGNDNPNIIGVVTFTPTQGSTDIDSSCASHRVYILANDKALYAAALSAALTGQTIKMYYWTGATTQSLQGHSDCTCRLSGIWW